MPLPLTEAGDTLRPLVPAGVFLTNEGFRLVLNERLKLMQCEEISLLKDTAISKLVTNNANLQYENTQHRARDNVDKEVIKELKKALRGKSITNGLGWGIVAVLVIKILF